MKNLKNILCSKPITLLFLFITCIYVYFFLQKPVFSFYAVGPNTIQGKIIKMSETTEKVVFTIQAKEKVQVTYYKKENENLSLSLGDTILVKGEITKPLPNTNFSLFNYENYLKSQHIFSLMEMDTYQILKKNQNVFYSIKNNLISYFKKFRCKNYLHAFLLGDTSYISDEVKTSYQINGISHLFAVSGMHVTLFISILSFFLKKITNRKMILLFLFSNFLLFYSFLASFSPSIVRGSSSYILNELRTIFNIPCTSLQILVFLFCLFLLCNPYLIYHTGFQFSFTISFFLILFQKEIRTQKNYFKKLFLISFISFCASLPILFQINFQMNIITLFLNLIFVPLVSLFLFPCLILLCIAPFLDFILFFILHVMEKLSLFFSQITYFHISMRFVPTKIFFLYFLFIYFVLKKILQKKYLYFLLFILVLFLHHYSSFFNKNTIVTMIDVGQGDAILIELPHAKGNILIDTGGLTYETKVNLTDKTLLPVFRSLGVLKLDYLILSHGDIDHMGEAIHLVNKFKVKKVVFNNNSYNDLEQELIKTLERKKIAYYNHIETIHFHTIQLHFLNTKIYDNENDNSNVIYTNIDGIKFLFMGDAEKQKEKDILEKYNLKNIDFLKVGHHGSDTSSSADFIKQITPKYSLIAVGRNNHYGHPKKSVLETLSNSTIYRTDTNGSIKIKINKKGYQIKTCLP